MLLISLRRWRGTWILGFMLAVIVAAIGPGFACSQERKAGSGSLHLSGWDPDETVPAYAYYRKGNRAMPVVICRPRIPRSELHHVEID